LINKILDIKSFEFNGKVFSHPSLKWKDKGNYINKAGKLSWLAEMDGVPVKIYECFNNTQAEFIEYISNHKFYGTHFPTCFMRDGVYIIAKWVEGTQLTWKQMTKDKSLLNEFSNMQVFFHSYKVNVIKFKECFNYISYIKDRLYRFKSIFPLDEPINKLLKIIDNYSLELEVCLSHPDLTPRNVILEQSTGLLKIIDNELMTINNYYYIDIFNTLFNIDPKIGSDILESYLECYERNGGNLNILLVNEEFFYAVWNIRLLGTLLQKGSFDDAFYLAKNIIEEKSDVHPIMNILRESKTLIMK